MLEERDGVWCCSGEAVEPRVVPRRQRRGQASCSSSRTTTDSRGVGGIPGSPQELELGKGASSRVKLPQRPFQEGGCTPISACAATATATAASASGGASDGQSVLRGSNCADRRGTRPLESYDVCGTLNEEAPLQEPDQLLYKGALGVLAQATQVMTQRPREGEARKAVGYTLPGYSCGQREGA